MTYTLLQKKVSSLDIIFRIYIEKFIRNFSVGTYTGVKCRLT